MHNAESTRTPQPREPSVREATVEQVETDAVLAVRLVRATPPRRLVARVAVPGYEARTGDRVLVALEDDEAFVVGVLCAAVAPLVLSGGERVSVADDTLELRDAEGALLFSYKSGAAVLSAPRGDLTLDAPAGSVRVRAGLDIALEAARDLEQRAARRVDTTAGGGASPQLRVGAEELALDVRRVAARADGADLTVGRVGLVARTVAVTAGALAHDVERYELVAERLVERTRTALRATTDLLEQRVGRLRTLVVGTWSLRARRTTLVSEEDTSIDGERVLLG